jgi:predicted ester cyclase
MSVEQNKTTLKRMYEEVWNTGDVSKVSELASPDYEYGDYKGPEGWGQVITLVRSAFPDLHYTIDQVIGEGDTLAYRLTAKGTHLGKYGNFEPTGKKVTLTQWFFSNFKEGKLLNTVAIGDMLSLLQQMGYLPPTEEIGK